MRGEIEDLILAQIAHFDRIMQVKSRHYAGASMGTDTEERLESALFGEYISRANTHARSDKDCVRKGSGARES